MKSTHRSSIEWEVSWNTWEVCAEECGAWPTISPWDEAWGWQGFGCQPRTQPAEPTFAWPAAFLHGTVKSGEVTQKNVFWWHFLTLKPEQIRVMWLWFFFIRFVKLFKCKSVGILLNKNILYYSRISLWGPQKETLPDLSVRNDCASYRHLGTDLKFLTDCQ